MSSGFQMDVEEIFDIEGMPVVIVGSFCGQLKAGDTIATDENEVIHVISVALPGPQKEKIAVGVAAGTNVDGLKGKTLILFNNEADLI